MNLSLSVTLSGAKGLGFWLRINSVKGLFLKILRGACPEPRDSSASPQNDIRRRAQNDSL
jgi:hypothetical protein